MLVETYFVETRVFLYVWMNVLFDINRRCFQQGHEPEQGEPWGRCLQGRRRKAVRTGLCEEGGEAGARQIPQPRVRWNSR